MKITASQIKVGDTIDFDDQVMNVPRRSIEGDVFETFELRVELAHVEDVTEEEGGFVLSLRDAQLPNMKWDYPVFEDGTKFERVEMLLGRPQ